MFRVSWALVLSAVALVVGLAVTTLTLIEGQDLAHKQDKLEREIEAAKHRL